MNNLSQPVSIVSNQYNVGGYGDRKRRDQNGKLGEIIAGKKWQPSNATVRLSMVPGYVPVEEGKEYEENYIEEDHGGIASNPAGCGSCEVVLRSLPKLLGLF